jgi:peptidoglycan/LPS O-acetylase OafA/YrhL
MLSTAPFLTEDLIGKVWFIGCAIGGLVFIAVGAKAGGLALFGAVAGAILGSALVASDFDQLAKGAMVGATIGTFVGGLLGLAWRSSASGVVLRALASITIVVGVLIVLAGRVESQRPCRPGWRYPCLPDVHSGSLALFALDAA